MSQAQIQLQGISKAFRTPQGTVWALQDISLQVGAGEFISIVGPSGCGKSTLFNIIGGLILPDQGRVLIDGEDVTGQKDRVSYMPQKDLLFPWRTVIDNVIIGQEIRGVSRQEARRKAQELIPVFGLEGFEHSYPAVLSGGMRQRAALLRTVLCERQIMLLDEPFGGLDALTRSRMQQWLLEVWEKLGRSILFITHDIEEAVYLSDRVYTLTSRPAQLKGEVVIDLPRPRQPGLVTTPEFVGYKKELLEAIHL